MHLETNSGPAGSKSTVAASFMNTQQIASEYPICVSTIWKQLKAGRFPQPIEVGRKRLWRRADVDGYFTPRKASA